MQAGVIIAIIFAIIVSIFALQNAQPVDIKFLTMEGEASLALVILLSVALGAAIMAMLNLYSKFKAGKNLKKVSKEKEALEGEKRELEGRLGTLEQEKAALEERLAIKEEQLTQTDDSSSTEPPQEEATGQPEFGTDMNTPQY
ncbi:LapA family protein [Alkalibacter rhizosphaerae]|uniref:LapA family protein n=1 Tax=Alkalibacter rhizosphaerae TaxID=2815577 RepID=A0A974XMT7_9FIRM|nr:LapA family protein [Alkalibacter rhizosphaerae]QSX08776.1 LapA family protein [Alkalibacter rhizosphaerae]